MAQKTYFINSDNALYDDEEFAWFQTLLLTAGIVGDPDTGDLNGYLVHENTTPSLAVLVDTGKALLEIQKDSRTFKIVVENLAQEALTIENNDGAAESRVDSIIINLDTSVEPDTSKTNVASIEVVKGDSATALTDSEIDTAVGDQFWYRLADVEVRADTTQILNSDITDQRTKIKFSEAWQREYDPISEEGDLVRGNVDGISERLPIGAEGQVLISSGGLPIWGKPATVNYKEFTSSGTWTKPDGLSAVIVEVIAAGGGGGGDEGGGGGGGAYNRKTIKASQLSSSESVTVGSGGSGGSPSGGDGEIGGSSHFGSLLSAYGGGGGGGGGDRGGGGGGLLSAGSAYGKGGEPRQFNANVISYSTSDDFTKKFMASSPNLGGGGHCVWQAAGSGSWGGGAGNEVDEAGGGHSVFGGGGGGGGDSAGGGSEQGGSSVHSGDGGDGGSPPTDGQFPAGGGGGGGASDAGGNGANGVVRIYEFF